MVENGTPLKQKWIFVTILTILRLLVLNATVAFETAKLVDFNLVFHARIFDPSARWKTDSLITLSKVLPTAMVLTYPSPVRPLRLHLQQRSAYLLSRRFQCIIVGYLAVLLCVLVS